ncbi:hypothetical protein DPMN_073752 [Dreissena polymorpha]|uniref:Uncharacterized protein n=1 Tax=Dreissena polymorpha TaxID=45954 RepID=A0A9D4BZN4_DREPO|nr:hypothetical protein DPMN_073752 [Dreissena polymorpha]
MSMSELARHLHKLDIWDYCGMSMSGLARNSHSSIFGTSSECRCQSWLDIRTNSIFWTSDECRCHGWLDIRHRSIIRPSTECTYQSWLDIHPSSIFGKCRMSMPELAQNSPSSIFVTVTKCRCQSWL